MSQYYTDYALQPRWADLRELISPPRRLADKIWWGLELYPCDLLFVHRDAETQSLEVRIAEITDALDEAASRTELPSSVCVVPVRMQEVWLLFHEEAIRFAAGNPNGRQPLVMPPIDTVESIPDPKELLYSLLRQASELRGRRLKKFRPNLYTSRVADSIDDFSPLRALTAFVALETQIEQLQL